MKRKEKGGRNQILFLGLYRFHIE